MNFKVAKWLFSLQIGKGILEEKDRSLYEYAYSILLSRMTIYSIVVLFGIVTQNLAEILAFLVPFTVLRQYAGGIHFEKAGRCLLISTIIILGCGQYLVWNRTVDNLFLGTEWATALTIIFTLAPVDNDKKTLKIVERIVYGNRARRILVFECIVAFVCFKIDYSIVAKGIVLAHIILASSLVMGIIKNYLKVKKTN